MRRIHLMYSIINIFNPPGYSPNYRYSRLNYRYSRSIFHRLKSHRNRY